MTQMQMIYRPQLKKVLNSVSLDTNLVHLFKMCFAGQKTTSGLEKGQTREGVIFAKGLDWVVSVFIALASWARNKCYIMMTFPYNGQ